MLLEKALKDSITLFNHIGEKDGEGVWSVTVINNAKADADQRFAAYRGTLTDCGTDEYAVYLMDAFIDARDLRGREKRFLPEAEFDALPDALKSDCWTLRANGLDCALLFGATEIMLGGEPRPPRSSRTHRITRVSRREWNVGQLCHYKVVCA